MMILADIGEIGIHTEGATYVLRPSLYAMSQLGTPQEIVHIFAEVMHDFGYRNDQQLLAAVGVLYACSVDEKIPAIFGEAAFIENQDKPLESKTTYKPGLVPEEHILPLARCLLKHGVTGAIQMPKREDDDGEPEYLTEFNAREHVSIAVAHLGCSERDAWGMTMTSLVGALRAKYPPEQKKETKEIKPPSVKQLEAADAWLDQINALR